MPKSRRPGIAISQQQEAFQTMPVRRAAGDYDRRSHGKALRLVGELSQYKPSQVAQSLGISTQKYVAIRRGIQSGKIANPLVNAYLDTGRAGIRADRKAQEKIYDYPRAKQGTYKNDKAGARGKSFKVDYVEVGQGFIDSKAQWAIDVKPGGFASLRSALNWYGNVTGGKEYFWIVRGNDGSYHIYDNRTASERAGKGDVSGQTKAGRLLDQYEDMRDEELEEDYEDEFDGYWQDALEA